MNQPGEEDNRGFVDHWRKVAPLLKARRDRELQQFDHHAQADLIDALLQLGFEFRRERTTSGLVEWQRRLHRRDE